MPSSTSSSSSTKKAQDKDVPNDKVNKNGRTKKRRRDSCPTTSTPATEAAAHQKDGKEKSTKKVTFDEHTSARRHSVPAQSTSSKTKRKKQRASMTEVDAVKETKNKKKSNKSSTNNKKKQKKNKSSKPQKWHSPIEGNASSPSSSIASKEKLEPLKGGETLRRPNAMQRRSSLASLASLDMDALFDAVSTTSSTDAQNEDVPSNHKEALFLCWLFFEND